MILHYLKEKKNGFTKWEIETYKKNVFQSREIKVFDILDKEIFKQIIDYKGNIEFTVKNAYYDGSYDEYESFYYDENGILTTEEIFIDDGWSGDYIKISDMKKQGFFDSDYGRYFVSASPEFPESDFLVTSYKEIYRNHLGELIDKEEIGNLYEYSKEIFENGLPKTKTTYKAENKKEFLDKQYKEYVESYHHNVREIPDNLELFYMGRNTMYFNRRFKNNYIVYDFLVRNEEDSFKIDYSGTVVYDNFYRLVSKIVYKERTKELVSGKKINYKYLAPLHKTDVKTEMVTVNFNSKGEIENYIDKSIYNFEFFSKERYQKELFFSANPMNKPYYKTLESLVPEEKAFPFMEFEQQTILYKMYGDIWDTEIEILLRDSKIKMALDYYSHYYFADKDEDISDIPHSDRSFNVIFFNTVKSETIIETDCLVENKIRVHFTIDLNLRTIDCRFH